MAQDLIWSYVLYFYTFPILYNPTFSQCFIWLHNKPLHNNYTNNEQGQRVWKIVKGLNKCSFRHFSLFQNDVFTDDIYTLGPKSDIIMKYRPRSIKTVLLYIYKSFKTREKWERTQEKSFEKLPSFLLSQLRWRHWVSSLWVKFWPSVSSSRFLHMN